jgi:hypothetical protein
MENVSGEGNLFRRRKSGDAISYKWPIERTPAHKPAVGICMSQDFFGAPIHYSGQRSVPCFGEFRDCELCDVAPPRWRLYSPAMECRGHQRCIMEMTDAVEGAWNEEFKKRRTLRGVMFKLSRKGDKHNGELRVKFADGPLASDDVPGYPSLEDMLLRMWAVPEVLRLAFCQHVFGAQSKHRRNRDVG